jgi:hypothetical protein
MGIWLDIGRQVKIMRKSVWRLPDEWLDLITNFLYGGWLSGVGINAIGSVSTSLMINIQIRSSESLI